MRHINRRNPMSNSKCAWACAQVHLYEKRTSLVGQAQLRYQHLLLIRSKNLWGQLMCQVFKITGNRWPFSPLHPSINSKQLALKCCKAVARFWCKQHAKGKLRFSTSLNCETSHSFFFFFNPFNEQMIQVMRANKVPFSGLGVWL